RAVIRFAIVVAREPKTQRKNQDENCWGNVVTPDLPINRNQRGIQRAEKVAHLPGLIKVAEVNRRRIVVVLESPERGINHESREHHGNNRWLNPPSIGTKSALVLRSALWGYRHKPSMVIGIGVSLPVIGSRPSRTSRPASARWIRFHLPPTSVLSVSNRLPPSSASSCRSYQTTASAPSA